ncbi:MAG: phenylalanine--tRNA ligase subunit beta, partial [Pseudomonadota bacterium]
WLKEHLQTEASLDEIVETLTDLGLEVEGVEDPAARLGAFTTCRVIEAVQHPDADRLRLCRVETWPNGPEAASEEVQVVCGAPNARTGLVGVFAAPGTHIPGTGVDLKPGVIRGVESNGMLCSERELEVSEDHDGIIDLPQDAPLGVRYIDYAGLNDPMIEIAITPNRPDALGVAGIARDLAARGLGRVITPPVEPVPGAFPSPIGVTLTPEVADEACPVFYGRLIRGVTNGPSPAWVQQKLRAIGLRPISALVDVTNLLTYDRARPLHVFDADKVHGNLHVRFARDGETLEALDGKTYALTPEITVIADDQGPEGLGGVMGGEPSGCTETTTSVFIESACFDPVRTAHTGRALKINSDARYRFERGIDPQSCAWGIELATRLILDLCGGEPSEVVVAGAIPDTSRSYPLNPARCESLVGMDIPRDRQKQILASLGFGPEDDGDHLKVSVPSWRPDVHGEADLVEEVARIASLTKLEAKPMSRPAGVTRRTLTPTQKRTAAVRRALAAQGFNECVTYSFVSAHEAALFGGDAEGAGEAMRLENPISSEMSHMRPDPLCGLMAAAARNQARGAQEIMLFETGPAFTGPEPGEQRLVASGLLAGAAAPREWTGSRRPVDVYDAKAAAEAALSILGAPVDRLMTLRDAAPAWLHPGRSAVLSLGPKTPLAWFGELHPRALEAMDLKGPAAAFSIFIEAVPEPRAKGPSRGALQASDLPAAERDFAFVMDAGVEADALLRAARGADKQLIESTTIFDVFEGASLGEGRKSVALSIRLQPKDRTLTDEEIDTVAAKVVKAVEKASGGQLRG